MTSYLFILLFTLWSVAAVYAEETPGVFLSTQLSFSARDISDLHAGKEISKVLDPSDKQEVVVAGAIPINVPKEMIIDAIRDITTFKKAKEVQAVGKFVQFEMDETKSLKLDDSELESLEKCKVKDCRWKLPASWIDRIAEERKRSGKDSDPAISRLIREMLVDYAKEYSSRGNQVMLQYDNDDKPLRSLDQFQMILAKSTYLVANAPEFHEFLKDFPDKQLPSESFIYWSKEKYGFKAVVSLTEVTFYQRDPGETVIASKQIFANHYFNGSLSLTFLFDHPLPNGKMGCYLIYVNRSRIDALDGFLSSIRRAIAIPRVHKALDINLKALRTKMEEKAEKAESK